MADGPPLKGCFARGGRGGGDGARAPGSRGIDLQVEIVRFTSPWHWRQGPRGEQSACGQGKYDPNPPPNNAQPPNTQCLSETHTWREYRSGQRGNLMLGSLPGLAVVARVPVSLGQSWSFPLKLSESINRERWPAWHGTVTGRSRLKYRIKKPQHTSTSSTEGTTKSRIFK